MHSVEANKPGDALRDIMTKLLIDASADTLAEEDTETVGDSSTNVKAEELLHTLALRGKEGSG